MENVTVDEAIKKGHRMITYPGLFIMLILMGLTFFIGLHNKQQVWIWPLGFCSSIVFSWLIWSVRITHWKVWAFAHVRNVHELRKRAIQQNLIWADNSFFNKTEIWNAADKEKWNLLQEKFNRKDEFIVEEDLTIPFETVIYYSKGSNFVEMVVMLLCLAVGIYMIAQRNNYVFGVILSLTGAYFAFKEFKEATNTAPQIIINEKGIQTISTQFYEWKDIKDEDVDIEGSGKYTQHYLTYHHPGGYEHLSIDDYNLTTRELRKLLKIYRSRSMTYQKHH